MGLLVTLAPGGVYAESRDSELDELLDMSLKELDSIEERAESAVNASSTLRVITEEQTRERGM